MNCSRRSLTAVIGSLMMMSYRAEAFSQPGNSAEFYSDKEAADQWIMQWMQSAKATAGGLYVGRFADRFYFLTREITWEPNPGQQAREVRVPSGFVTDFASIPRPFWIVLPTDGPYAFAAIIHDYLYWDQAVARDEADLIFKYAMEDFKIHPATIHTIYAAVRKWGGGAWRQNAIDKAAGERRIIQTYPSDAKIRWTEWKMRAGVF